MKSGEALFIKVLEGGDIGCKYFDGEKWVAGKIFPYPWHIIMSFFNDLEATKEYTCCENSTLKEYDEKIPTEE